MKLAFGVCALALLVAACSPDTETAPAETAGVAAEADVLAALCASTPSTSPVGAAPPSDGAAAKRFPLPNCTDVETTDAGADGWKHPDCRLMFPDESGMAFEARYSAAEDESTKIEIQIVAKGDATLQTIEEIMGNTFNGPSLQDVDQDGRLDLLVPLETGNVNTTWAVYRQVAEGVFIKAGEPNGVGIQKSKSGCISVEGRSSASEYFVSFYKMAGDEMKPVATAEVAGRMEGDKVTGADCTLADDGGIAAAGVNVETARRQFCAEPPVQQLISDMTGTP